MYSELQCLQHLSILWCFYCICTHASVAASRLCQAGRHLAVWAALVSLRQKISVVCVMNCACFRSVTCFCAKWGLALFAGGWLSTECQAGTARVRKSLLQISFPNSWHLVQYKGLHQQATLFPCLFLHPITIVNKQPCFPIGSPCWWCGCVVALGTICWEWWTGGCQCLAVIVHWAKPKWTFGSRPCVEVDTFLFSCEFLLKFKCWTSSLKRACPSSCDFS